MTVIVGASAHGSPGVSTALQLVAAAMDDATSVPVIVEVDAAGGVLAARYELSLTPGFVSLAESLRKSEAPPLLDHAQRLPSGVACVSLSPSATAAGAQMRSAGPFLGSYLADCGHPVLLDAGTIIPDGKAVPALMAADLLLWFVRPTREELLVLRHRLAECPQPDNVAIVLVGDTPYNASQVAAALGTPVLHTLPIDRRGAAAVNLGGDDRHLRRSQLARSCKHLASLLHEPGPAQVVSPSSERRGSPGRGVEGRGAEPLPPPPEPPANAETEDFDDGEIKVWTPDSTFAKPASDDPDVVVWVNDQE